MPVELPRTIRVVALFARSDRLGGAERSTIELASTSQRSEWLILIRFVGDVRSSTKGPVAELCESLGVRYELVRGIRDVRRWSQTFGGTVVYAFGLRWSLTGRFLVQRKLLMRASPKRPRFVSAQRGLDPERRWMLRRADQFSQTLVDAYLANSAAAAYYLQKSVGIRTSRVKLIRSGLSEEWFGAPSPLTSQVSKTPRIVLVGNYRPEKAYPDAIAILDLIRNEEWWAIIYSDQRESLDRLIRAANLDSRVTLVVGHRMVPHDYDDADILLHAASSESFPRAVLEASSRGCRVVATSVGDVPVVISSEYLFTPGHLTDAALALRKALHETRAIRRSNAISTIPTQLDVADRFDDLILQLFDSP